MMKKEDYNFTWKEFTSNNATDITNMGISFNVRNLLVDYITDIFEPEDTETMRLELIVSESLYTLFIHVPDCDTYYHIDANVVITFLVDREEETILHAHMIDTCYCTLCADLVVKSGKLEQVHVKEY